jgi:hypothetical protein
MILLYLFTASFGTKQIGLSNLLFFDEKITFDVNIVE